MIEMPEALADFLAERKREFAGAMPERAAQVESLWRAAGPAPFDAEDLSRVEIAAHGLAGTAEMLGFDRFGACARAVERQVRELRLAGASATGQTDAIEAALRSLRAAAGGAP